MIRLRLCPFWPLLAAGLFGPGIATAADCENVEYRGQSFAVCEVKPAEETLDLFLYDPNGQPHGQFGRLDQHLNRENKQLVFAMNAGMYHDNRAPVGHYVENGTELMRVITSEGPGNFGMLPNGVLCLRSGRADVIETLRFVAEEPDCLHATQSGPMLVIEGEVHPRLLPAGTSKFIRNGVGTSADGTRAIFVISNELVNFHSFASFFRDYLGVPNALYLDGKISRLYAPALGRNDLGFPLGPIIGVTAPLD